jgi:HAD superfamily hydrolase (TIGR01549 family)
MTENVIRESAAIFDIDGKLVDSFTPRKNTHRKVSAFLLSHLGRHSNETDMKRMLEIISKIDIEMHQNKIYDRNMWWPKALKRYAGKPADLPEPTITEASTLYWESIKNKSTVYPGARNMLHALKHEGIKIGLISDTDGLKNMKTERIEASGLARLFDAIVVAGEDTTHVKPDSEPYILIAERLKVTPRDCVSIGDNPATDVYGALRAGMKTIIIMSRHAPQTGSSQRYYLVERKKMTQFIINSLRTTSSSTRT